MRATVILIFILITEVSLGQVINISGAVISGMSDATANDHLVPDPVTGPLVFDQQACTHGAFTPGLYGNDYASYCFVHAKEEGQMPQHHEVSSYIGSRAMINGDNTSLVNIKWKNTGTNYATSDGHDAIVTSSLDFIVNMEVTGLPPGTPVTVYWWFNVFGGGSTSHEDITNEDSIFVTNSMSVNGDPQFTNQFNFASPNGLPGWNEWKNVTGTFKVIAGADFNFIVSSNIRLYLNIPAGPGGFGFGIDQNDGIFKGEIFFTLVPQYPLVLNNTEDMLTLFSVDIGSDTEVSDYQQDGNEFFDPGDLYLSNYAMSAWWDDSLLWLMEPNPRATPPINPAPVGSGLSIDAVRPVFFDLDGSDLIGVSLLNLTYGPGNPSVPWFSDDCIHEAEFLFISFDDDTSDVYTRPAPGSVPANSSSPYMGVIYSDLGSLNEVLEYVFDPFPASAFSYEGPVYSEQTLHSYLGPNPSGNNNQDDDVDALDMIPEDTTNSPCDYCYFSADHEAAFNHPNLGGPYTNPASIILATPTGPVSVINSIHHGLSPGTDIDAFEFAWVWDNNENRFGLALLFSVNDDDPATADDESGGLNPRMIYHSFLNGSSQPFTAHQLNDDIDGIAVWHHSLNGTASFPNPVWGTKTWQGTFNARWQNPLNWFPRGVPFDPEEVMVPNLNPSPIIGISGLDCKSIDIEPGAQIILRSGETFSVKGQ